MHPNLIAALARISWRRQPNQRPRREARHRANPQAGAWPWTLTTITSTLRIVGKGASS